MLIPQFTWRNPVLRQGSVAEKERERFGSSASVLPTGFLASNEFARKLPDGRLLAGGDRDKGEDADGGQASFIRPFPVVRRIGSCIPSAGKSALQSAARSSLLKMQLRRRPFKTEQTTH